MKNTSKQFLGILFIAALFTSCSINMLNRVNGNRNVVVKERKLQDNVSGIKVSTGIDVFISQGNENSIVIEADENLHDIIMTDTNNGVLNIYSEKNIWKAKAKKVYVTVKKIALIKATSGSDVRSKTIIKSNEISIAATSGATINIEIDAQSVTTSTSSGANIKVSGTALNHASNATSGSAIAAYNLKSENVIAKATSGAEINIHAFKKIEAKVSSGGDVTFRGNPTVVLKKATSGGNVSRN
jgi:hypothetical protein